MGAILRRLRGSMISAVAQPLLGDAVHDEKLWRVIDIHTDADQAARPSHR